MVVSGMTRSWGLSSVRKRSQAEDLQHAGADAIGAAGVPVVVKAQDRHAVGFEEGPFGGVDGVVRESAGSVLVIVESGLVRDDEVTAGLGGALHHVEGGHHGGGDALHGRIGATRFERVDGGSAPRHTEVLLNALDHLTDGERRFGCGQVGGQKSSAGGREKSASGRHGSLLPRRLQEQGGGLLIARIANSLAMALGGGGCPLSGIDGGQHVREFLQAADTKVEGHIEERFLGGCRIGVPVGKSGGE